jgi:DNA (cytosine-5)-methyltransferase 1
MYIHPNENRGLSSHEMAALQSFPDNYEFRARNKSSVTLVSVGKQIGNAVPPLLGRALGLAVRSFIK